MCKLVYNRDMIVGLRPYASKNSLTVLRKLGICNSATHRPKKRIPSAHNISKTLEPLNAQRDSRCYLHRIVGTKEYSVSNLTQGFHVRSSDPCEISSLCKPTIATSQDVNPLLIAQGESTNDISSTETSGSLDQQQDDNVTTHCDLRRSAFEASERSRALLRCKNTLILGTYNVNTLR